MKAKPEVTPLDVYCGRFKARDFNFIVKRFDTGETHEKQRQALEILTDTMTTEFLFGGAAGGSKSWTFCTWLLFSCLLYPGIKCFIGREELKRLRGSTLITFFKVSKEYGAKKDKHWKYNGQDHFIEFTNGSRIDLLDLQYMPSDPLYERYGSTEYTMGWLEEAGEVNFGAFDTLKGRVGRHLNDQYGLIRKTGLTANPKQNWLYTEFYKPAMSKALPAHRKYLSSLVTDNPFISKGYIEALESTTDEVRKQRLLYGNWDYDSNPLALIRPAMLLHFLQGSTEIWDGIRYLSADIAFHGSDKFVIIIWEMYAIIDILVFEKMDSADVLNKIEEMADIYQVQPANIVYDSDGLGNYLRGFLKDAIPFNNGGKPMIPDSDKQALETLKKENLPMTQAFANLKTQCLFKLAELINSGLLRISKSVILTMELRERLQIELTMIQRDRVDDERTLHTLPKEDIKQKIGHSPDITDAIMMRMIFLLAKVNTSPYDGLSKAYSNNGDRGNDN